jgi:hypothetical protein
MRCATTGVSWTVRYDPRLRQRSPVRDPDKHHSFSWGYRSNFHAAGKRCTSELADFYRGALYAVDIVSYQAGRKSTEEARL